VAVEVGEDAFETGGAGAARAESMACVFEGRSSHQPSAWRTRAPSMASNTAPSFRSADRTVVMAVAGSVPGTVSRSSGVAKVSGIASRSSVGVRPRRAQAAMTRKAA
jgi:hypothetical protein